MTTTATQNTKIPTIWLLKDKKPFIRRWQSGQDLEFSIRIMWSQKLGLALKTTFETKKEAQELIQRIIKHGKINTDNWDKTFNPTHLFCMNAGD